MIKTWALVLILIVTLVPVGALIGITASLGVMRGMSNETKAELHELMLGHAQTHASKRGIKWSEAKELANVAAMADSMSLPVSLPILRSAVGLAVA